MLDLTGCSELVLISPNVIASLTNLEDLRMGRNSFKHWEAEAVLGSETRHNASLLELKQLFKLTAIDIHIPDANILPSDLFSKLDRFHIFIGEAWEWLPFDNRFNTLKLQLTTANQLDRCLEMLLKRSEHLYLDVMDGVNNIFHLLNRSDGFQLKHLRVQNNAEITYVINHNAFQKLQYLTLMNLPKLVSFSSKPVVPTRRNKQLKIDGESREIMLDNEIGTSVQLFKNGEIVIPNLTSLIVHKCNGLRFLLSSSMARSLAQLKHLELYSCQIMEEVVSLSTKELGEERVDDIFCKLHHLQLQYLPKLKRFCSGNFIKFPSLEILHIEDCMELGAFISDPPMMNNNTTICKDNSESDLNDNLETVGPYFLFDEKVAFPSLERLIIYGLPRLMTIWHNQLAQESFCRLKKLNVLRCYDLINIFAGSIMGRLNALDTLQIENCKSLQVLFELDDASSTQLRIVECCQNLDLVKIILCERLKNIFPVSVAKGLHNLRMLHVRLCNGVEAIVGKEEGPQTTIKFMFPKVISVKFENLPQLTSFYPGKHASKWPLLKELRMTLCSNVGIFAAKFSRIKETIDGGVQSTQPFFCIKKGSFLNLESLTLGAIDLDIWDGPLPAELFSKLKYLDIASSRFTSSAAFLLKLHNLENLFLLQVPFTEIFVNEGSSREMHAVGTQLPHLKSVTLSKLPRLVHLGKDNSQPFIPNLEILQVFHCEGLRNLTSPAIAFQNLTSLIVIGCHGLEFLTTCSIAQSLMQLKHMEVENCRGLIQILENSNQDSGSVEIAFIRLQHLELSGLPSLQGFCSGNCIVKLPSLDTLTVSDCLIELELSPEKLLLSNSRPERIKLIEEEGKDHDKPEG